MTPYGDVEQRVLQLRAESPVVWASSALLHVSMFVNGIFDMFICVCLRSAASLRRLASLVSQPLFTFIYTQLFIAVQFGDYAQARPRDVDGGWGGAEDGESRLGRGPLRSLGKTVCVGHVSLRGEGPGRSSLQLPLAPRQQALLEAGVAPKRHLLFGQPIRPPHPSRQTQAAYSPSSGREEGRRSAG